MTEQTSSTEKVSNENWSEDKNINLPQHSKTSQNSQKTSKTNPSTTNADSSSINDVWVICKTEQDYDCATGSDYDYPKYFRSRSRSPLNRSTPDNETIEAIDYTDTIAFRKFLAINLIKLVRQTEQLDARLQMIESKLERNAGEGVINTEEEFTLPLQTVQQLEDFELALEKQTTFESMVQRLTLKCGGTKLTLVTSLVLQILLTNELATEYSWQGRKRKRPLNKMIRLTMLIMRVTQKVLPTCSEVEISTAASQWLAQASTRLKRSMAPEQSNPLPL